ncbi:FAD-dependent monooxygenase [Beauveria brongniartii RCEF 3172]|uniref:FAD-dependent monooxygenase n=1 Tax=Beauveria brongniartii RCEF 3172 TaxID=1081107 RepID=A0A167JYM6_9HYPO|nr:FAD-dependent monooxygenase [Beauveria brongniartii RCEF 3172]
MSPSVAREHYPVAIVGGGIAGLTLALALERQDVSYVLLECASSLSPDKGASVGLQPNGLRILDQLGLLDEIEKHTGTLQRWRHLDGQGALISETKALGHYESLVGYGPLFLERRKLLEIMADGLEDKFSTRTSIRVLSLEESSEHVTIALSNGQSMSADLVIGADGVHSCVRDAIQLQSPTWPLQANLKTEFACVYGISSPVRGIAEGDCFSVYRPEATILIFTGRESTIFWFVFEDLGPAGNSLKRPEYTIGDIHAFCSSIAHLRITPLVRFGHVFANKSVAVKVPLEEGISPVWHTRRMVLVGDAAHKMVPNAAMGANQAIESAATLLNQLRGLFSRVNYTSPEQSHLSAALERYTEIRKPRATEIAQRAGMVCRAQLLHSGPAAAIRDELPTLNDGDWLFRGFMGMSDSPVIDTLPLSWRGKMFGEAMEKFWERVRARQGSNSKTSNMALFDLES